MVLEWYWAGTILLGCVITGMCLGFPVAFTFLITNIIGMCIFVVRGYSTIGEFFEGALRQFRRSSIIRHN